MKASTRITDKADDSKRRTLSLALIVRLYNTLHPKRDKD